MKTPDTPPMSAEDRAIDVIGEWLDDGEAAVAILEALSSEGLAVVAREDVEALLDGVSLSTAHHSPEVFAAWDRLRRLSGADG